MYSSFFMQLQMKITSIISTGRTNLFLFSYVVRTIFDAILLHVYRLSEDLVGFTQYVPKQILLIASDDARIL